MALSCDLMDETVRKSWERFLDPDVLRPNLITASLYIAAFELLKTMIIERLRDFYTVGFDRSKQKNGGWIVDRDYQARVLSRNSSPLYASLDWLKESGAIDDQDISAFDRTKECRNKVAHDIAKLLSAGLPADLRDRFAEILALVDKIERWWIVSVEIPTNPDFDGEEIDESGVVPGSTMWLQVLVDVALGNEKESEFYLNDFMRRTR